MGIKTHFLTVSIFQGEKRWLGWRMNGKGKGAAFWENQGKEGSKREGQEGYEVIFEWFTDLGLAHACT